MHTQTQSRTRLAIARLWHESNSFNPVPVRLAQFRNREWIKGTATAECYGQTTTEMGAAHAFLRMRPTWEGHFLRCTSAPPGGPVVQDDLDTIIDEIVTDIQAQPWDAVYLSLHGAVLGTGDISPDTTLLRRVRAAVGPDVPVAVSFDMHACLNPEIADYVDILTGYRTYPHVDMDRAAGRALALLERTLAGEIRPMVSLRPVPMLPLSHRMRTDEGPMAELVALADAEARAPEMHDATLFGGFAYADSPHAHATVSLCHESGAGGVLPVMERLGTAMLERRAAFHAELPDARSGLTQALQQLEDGARWPVAVVEPADNPLSGGLGDTTGLFRALLEQGIDLPAVFCFFHDPDLVDWLHVLGTGAYVSVQLGGRVAPEFGPPVPFGGHITLLTDGRFSNCGPMERGMPVDLGRTAVLQKGALKVIISESCQSANDPGWCALHDIDLAQTALFCVKAKNHFRAAFGALCGAIIEVETPGPAPTDLTRLSFTRVPPEYLIQGQE
ncbi:MAG: M81 family metallopeptidase [Pararhodobacter sp.]|nr:M81 family metallopeptidase [Pararhodobacter sp.]